MNATPWEQQDEKQRKRTLSAAKRMGIMHGHPAWALMVGEARAKGWPKAFEADLYVHDRAELAKTPHDRPFLWAIGETGTSLFWLDGLTCQRDKAASIVDHLNHERPLMMHWDGVTLWRCTEYDARAVLRGVKFGDLDNY